MSSIPARRLQRPSSTARPKAEIAVEKIVARKLPVARDVGYPVFDWRVQLPPMGHGENLTKTAPSIMPSSHTMSATMLQAIS